MPVSMSSRKAPPGCRSARSAPTSPTSRSTWSAGLTPPWSLRPTLFGYQHVLALVPHAEEAIIAVDLEDDSTVFRAGDRVDLRSIGPREGVSGETSARSAWG